MTQADIVVKNEETLTNINLIKNLVETYDNAVAGTLLKNMETDTTSPNDHPSTSQQSDAARPTDFDSNEFSPYALNEQSPIKPSKYFANDRLI